MPTKSDVKVRLNSDTKHIAVLESDPSPLGSSVNVAAEFKCLSSAYSWSTETSGVPAEWGKGGE